MISVILAALERIGTRPSRVLSVSQLPARESQPELKRARRNFHLALSFSEEDMDGTIQPHDNALVITLRIGGYDVKRVMVDGGNAAEVMYPDLYKGLGLKSEDLKIGRASCREIKFTSTISGSVWMGSLIMPFGMTSFPSKLIRREFRVLDPLILTSAPCRDRGT